MGYLAAGVLSVVRCPLMLWAKSSNRLYKLVAVNLSMTMGMNERLLGYEGRAIRQ